MRHSISSKQYSIVLYTNHEVMGENSLLQLGQKRQQTYYEHS